LQAIPCGAGLCSDCVVAWHGDGFTRGRGRPGSLGVVLVAVESVGLFAVDVFVDVVADDLHATIADPSFAREVVARGVRQ
jgi:hypothetical protein